MSKTKTVFFQIANEIRVASGIALACWRDIEAGYRASNRYYHVLAHVDSLLVAIDRFGGSLLMPGAVRLAAIFHDARDTEEASAELARYWMTRMGFSISWISAVCDLVLMTKGHRPLEGLLADDSALLSDCDLLILAAPRKKYIAYTRKIRREYSHFDDAKFNDGRKAVLESFSKRDPIYFTKRIHRLYEHKAKANLAWELQQLATAA